MSFLTEKKEITLHSDVVFKLLLVLERSELNYQGDLSSFPPYRCQIFTAYVNVWVDIAVQKKWTSLCLLYPKCIGSEPLRRGWSLKEPSPKSV